MCLGSFVTQLWAAPSYLKRHGVPKSPADLVRHVFVGYIEELVQVDAVRWLEELVPEPKLAFTSNSMISQLGADRDKVDFNAVWHELCLSHYRGEDTPTYLINRSLMRPRNLLKIFNHLRGFAGNFNRTKIDDVDIEKGMKAYSADLLEELDRELTDVFPEAKDLLYQFLDATTALTPEQLKAILDSAGIKDHERVVDFLLYCGVIGIKSADAEYFIFNLNYDLKVLEIRASRGDAIKYIVNPAFWPALGIKELA